MTRSIAITRAISRALEHCELSYIARHPIDVALARQQHAAYEDALRGAGCEVWQLSEQADMPDSVFVEDTVIVLDEIAVLTRPGAASRRGEVDSMAAALEGLCTIARIEAPGTLDGGDVLRLDRVVYVGASARSNAAGIAQLARHIAPYGYRVEAASLRDCLHLKSAVTQVSSNQVLVNPRWIDVTQFTGWQAIEIDPAEPHAANALRIGDAVIYPASCPRTAQRLRDAGIDVRCVDMSETEKAEGAVTCCSVILNG
jgi:dimethylargininase